jgi:hypothetical protein
MGRSTTNSHPVLRASVAGLGVGSVLAQMDAGKGLLDWAGAEGWAESTDWERWVKLVDFQNWLGLADYQLWIEWAQSIPWRAAAVIEWSWTHMRWPDLAAMLVQPALLLALVPPCLAAALLAWEDSLTAENDRACGVANAGMEKTNKEEDEGVAEEETEMTQRSAPMLRQPLRARRRGSLSSTPEGRGRNLQPTASAPAPSTPRALRQLTRWARLCLLAYSSRSGVVAKP